MDEHIVNDHELVVAELQFQFGLTPPCSETIGPPNPGPDDNHLYCARFSGHEQFGLDHQAVNGTTW